MCLSQSASIGDSGRRQEICKNFKQKINLPNVGDHVEVTGIHMLDNDHGWLEIHPVIKIKKLP